MVFRASSTSLLILSALLFQWLYNGLNYVAFKIGAGDVPPLLLSAMRFSLASVVVFPPALAAIARLGWPPRRQIMFSAISGIIMLVFSQALVLWGDASSSCRHVSPFCVFCPSVHRTHLLGSG